MWETSEMAGAVKWFSLKKGYGFIEPEAGPPDILFLKSTLRRQNLNHVRPGSRVRCLVEKSPKGLHAVEFVAIDQSADSPSLKVVGVKPLAVLETAIVKRFDESRGFGFLKSQLNPRTPDIFVHMETLRHCRINTLQPGQQVKVTYGRGRQGLVALDLEKV